MSRTWCTTLEESIVSEYLDGILNRKKKALPPRSPYEASARVSKRASSAHRPSSAPRGGVRPASREKQAPRPKTSCSVKKSSSGLSSRSLGSTSSINSSQLSVYSANVQVSRVELHYMSRYLFLFY